MAIWIPSRPSPDNIGKYQVQEAVFLLERLSIAVEEFREKNGRVPDVQELGLPDTSGKYVATLSGSNPYLAIMKKDGVYAEIAGKSLGWQYDLDNELWLKCNVGTIDMRFKSLECRRQ